MYLYTFYIALKYFQKSQLLLHTETEFEPQFHNPSSKIVLFNFHTTQIFMRETLQVNVNLCLLPQLYIVWVQ